MTETPETTPETSRRPGMSPMVRVIVVVVGIVGIVTGVMKVMQGLGKTKVDPELARLTEESDAAFQAANGHLTEAGPAFQAILDGVDKDGLEAVRATKGEEVVRVAGLYAKAAEQFRVAAGKAIQAAAKKPGAKVEAFLAAKAEAYTGFAEAREINGEILLMVADPAIKTLDELEPKVLEAAGRRDGLEMAANKAIERGDAMVKEVMGKK